MATTQIRDRLAQVSLARLRADLYHLCADPLPCRRANVTLPGHQQSTLAEADAYLAAQLAAVGLTVERESVPVQAYRCDMSKPPTQWYSAPQAGDPWYLADNLTVTLPGGARPAEIILACAHKDSQSWIASPGAYDTAVGTIALLELARLLADAPLDRTVRLLWCNEEHSPWTSIHAAQQARARGDHLLAVLNTDGLGGRPSAWQAAGRRTNVTRYTTPEGRPLAELCAEVNAAYGIGLEQSLFAAEHPNDDDGSFIKAGYRVAVANIGSLPYRHDWYHQPQDTADQVDLENVAQGCQLVLGTILRLDRDGLPPG
ncbi:MAG: M28 family peptidase [Fimbriimonadaceae bacterium]|nr:M28 family peptidase [Fimbriimonadaceae bacterium]